MKKLILIRHGETRYTVEKRYCGKNETPLNATGIMQAEKLHEKLKSLKVDTVYSSDIKRALQTAKIVFPGRPIIEKTCLQEINFGNFVGKTWEEASKVYPKIYNTWLEKPMDAEIPGGEKIRDFEDRIKACFEKIKSETNEKTVAIVSHGGPIRVILLYILNRSMEDFWNIEQDTTAVNMLEMQNDKLEVLKINDTSHLKTG